MDKNDVRKQFEQLLTQTVLPENTPKEDFNNVISKVFGFAQSNYPDELYKYRACSENTFDAFDKDALWASNPSAFNDPHDCLPYCDEAKVNQAIIDNAKALIRYIKETGNIPDLVPQIFGKANVEKVNMVEYYRDMTDEEIESDIKKNLEHQSFYEQFSYFRKDFEARHQINTRIISLSGKSDSSLMWAHYADYHKGFVLSYKTPIVYNCRKCIKSETCPDKRLTVLLPVIYSPQRHDITDIILYYLAKYVFELSGNPFIDPNPDVLYKYKINTLKSVDWNYEDEWRLMCSCPNQDILSQNHMAISGIKPEKIYYGARISNINKKILSDIANRKNIQQFQMRIDDRKGTYEMYSVPI